MKKIALTTFTIILSVTSLAQDMHNSKIIELSKSYKNYMFRNEPNANYIKSFTKGESDDEKNIVNFIKESISTNNNLLTNKYLTRPNDNILKQIYIIRHVNYNLRENDLIDNNKLIDSLRVKEIPTYELLQGYYSMLFTSIGNKNRPLNLSKTDLKINDYQFNDDTEKGIFFLTAMSNFGKFIWGYMNVVNPPNTKEALNHIYKYPKFNGQPYYQYNDFYFKDFEMVITDNDGLQSFKNYYIDQFYEVLLNHLICLNEENASDKEAKDLLLGSILKERNLYKFTKHESTLKQIFQIKE